MKMIRRIIFGIFILSVIFGGPLYSQDFKIIVNESNAISSLTRVQISNLFLKKRESFPNGVIALPVDLKPDDPIRVKFTTEIHKRDVKAVGAYWQQMIFRGKGIPPPEKKTEVDVIEYVRMNPGAIGYTSVSISSPNIKEIEVK